MSKSTSSEKKEISYVELEKKYTEKLSKIIYSEAIQQGKINLLDVLKNNKVNNPEKIIENLKNITEAKIMAKVNYYSIIMFTYMEKSNNWTEAGQDRVKLSYIRLLLDIPSDKEVSFQDYSNFDSKIKELQEKHQLLNMSESDLKILIDYPEFELFGNTFIYTETKAINNLLAIFGSERRIMVGSSGKIKSIMFGISKSTKYGKYDIYYYIKEEARTPNNVHYIVAVIEKEQIAIRYDVCKYVFYNKWLPVFDYDMFEMESFRTVDEESISECIKKSVVDMLEVKTKDEFIAKTEYFLELMSENLLYHELSHDAFEDINLNNTELAIIDGLSAERESILSLMNEVITEWMPQKNDVKGPIRNIVDTALVKGNPLRAKQMLFMYLSDAWFLDTDTTFMYPYNYIMFVILLKYIHPDKDVDFVQIYYDFNNIFECLNGWYTQTIGEVYLKVKKINYKDKGQAKTYEDLEKDVNKLCQKAKDKWMKKDFNEKEKEGNYWINFFVQLRRRDKSVIDNLFDFIEAKQEDLYKLLMTKFVTAEDQKIYGTDIRKYIIEKMKTVGFVLGND